MDKEAAVSKPSEYQFSSLAVSYPWLAILFVVVLVGMALAGVSKLSFSNDIRVFFGSENPQLNAYERVEGTYANSNSVLFVVVPERGDVFTRETLMAVEYLTQSAWELPHSRRVESIANFQNTYAEEDDLIVEDLYFGAAELSPEEIERIQKTALEEPLIVNRLVSPDGSVTAVNVPISLPGIDPLAEQPEVAEASRALAREIEERFPGHKVKLTGITMINQALSEETEKDMGSFGLLMIVFIVIALGVMLRQWTASLGAFLVIILSILAAFGFAGWLGIGLSPPVISAINMIMTMAVADSIHLLASFAYYRTRHSDRRDAMRVALRSNFGPIFFTTFTTVIGFLSLNASESPPFRDLGNIVAIGVTVAWILVLTLLPAIMVLIPSGGAPSARSLRRRESLMSLANWIAPRRWLLLLAGIAVSVVMAVLAFRSETNDEFLKYFDESTTFRQDTEYTIDNLTGFEFIEFSLEAGGAGSIAEPEYLRKVEAFADWLREQPKVRHVYAFSDIMKRLNRNLNGDDPSYYRLPETRQEAAQYLLLYEMSLPFGQDLTDQIDLNKSATLLRASLTHISSNEMIELDRAAQQWLRTNELSPDSVGTGQSIMFAYIGMRNIQGLLTSTVGALVLISFLMIFITRSIKFGLASLLPNLAPAAIAFGVWGLLVGQVGLGLSVVVGMTLGIVVDDSIHFIVKYLTFSRGEGRAPVDALRETFASVGGAMLATTITLVGGFMILAFSSFELNSSMGLLSAITIAIALGFDFLVLPALLLVLDHRRLKLTSEPKSES